MRFTTCIRDIYHQVSGDTLPHRAINRNKTALQGVGDELNTDLADLTDAMLVGCFVYIIYLFITALSPCYAWRIILCFR